MPSPYGTKIAYTGFDYKGQSYTVTHVYMMNGRQQTEAADRDSGPRCQPA